MSYSFGLNPEEKQQKSEFKDSKTQKMLNEPIKVQGGYSPADKEFLDLIVNLIDEGKIDLYKPATLINMKVYEDLSEEEQGKADFEAVNLLSAIREIKELFDQGYEETFQMENAVQRLRFTKERIEEAGGDLYII